MTTLEKIKAELKQFEDRKKQLVDELRKEFPSIILPLFEDSGYKSIGWTQYTPWFMDSDTCEFSVNSDNLYIDGEYKDDYESEHNLDFQPVKYTQKIENQQQLDESLEIIEKYYPGNANMKRNQKVGNGGYIRNPNYTEKEANIYKRFVEVIRSIPEDFMKDLFGDHVMITVHSTGKIDVEEYEHD